MYWNGETVFLQIAKSLNPNNSECVVCPLQVNFNFFQTISAIRPGLSRNPEMFPGRKLPVI